MKIDANDLIAQELFKQKFTIPRFQRKYSWKEPELSKFWEDIISNPEDGNDSVEIDNQYFIGSVIVYPSRNSRKSIIDGQQRITTLTILFASLRDHFFRFDTAKSLAEALHRNIIEDQENINGDKEFILNNEVMSAETWECFMNFILDENSRKKTKPSKKEIEKNAELKNILNAYDFFFNSIDETLSNFKNEAEKVDYLKIIRDKLLNVKLIEIVLEDFSKAYTIFNTLNSRGKNLSDSDLIKSRFTELLDSKSQNDETLFIWRRIEQNLDEAKAGNGRANHQLFFYDSFISRSIPVSKKSEIYPAYQEYIKQENAQEELQLLEQDSQIYRNIFNKSYPIEQYGFNEINDSLRALSLFNVIQPSSLLLSLIRKNQNSGSSKEKLSTKNLREALKILENFHFVYNSVTSSPGNRLNNIYPKYARNINAIKDNGQYSKEIVSLKNNLLEKMPSEQEFILKFREINYNTGNVKDRELIQYILKKFHIEGYSFKIDGNSWEDMSVEHILSEAEAKRANISESVYGKVGNLIYINKKINETRLNDFDFIDKKDIFIEESLEVPDTVLESSEWTIDTINSRTDEMARIAYNSIWNL